MMSKRKYFLISLIVVVGATILVIWNWSRIKNSDFKICSSASTSEKVLMHTESCFYDSCSYSFFSMDGEKLGSFSGDGSAASEIAGIAKYVKNDCKNVTSGYFYSRLNITE